MDVLIVLGTSTAWVYGISLMIIGYPSSDALLNVDENTHIMDMLMIAHNFEISSLLITTILLGKYLETYVKKKTI